MNFINILILIKIIAPKQEKLKQAEMVLKEQMARLEEKKTDLAKITEKLKTLYDELAIKQMEQMVIKKLIEC